MSMTFSTVEDAIRWLDSQTNDTQRKGIDKIRVALDYFGNPQHGLPVIHITGTNGKGSTTSYLKQLLLSQDLRVGTFTSPHIMQFNERITYNGLEISDSDLIDLVEQMVKVNDYMETTPYGRLVFFELYTVMMTLYFHEKQPDVCLIEVGIGGENDCTNVLDGQIAILTTIGLDHEEKLGHTVEEVATEKAGIIKENAVVITGPIATSPLKIITDKVKRVGASHFKFGVDYGYQNLHLQTGQGSQFDYWYDSDYHITLPTWAITMLGKYQVDNATVAMKAFFAWMHLKQLNVNLLHAMQALKQTRWMARMERINDSPLIYIDGAHNVHGLLALRSLLEEYFPNKEITILYAGLTTKNQEEQLPILLSFKANQLYLTEFDHANSMTLSEFDEVVLENDAIQKSEYELIPDWKSFVYDYVKQDHRNQMLLITGSLYFASEVRQLLAEKVKL